MSPSRERDRTIATTDDDEETYADDPVVQQLADIGQRIEIMLEAAGGPFLASPETPTDLPSDVIYQRTLTTLSDDVTAAIQHRRTLLRDDADEAAMEAEAEAEAEADAAPKKGSSSPPKKS